MDRNQLRRKKEGQHHRSPVECQDTLLGELVDRKGMGIFETCTLRRCSTHHFASLSQLSLNAEWDDDMEQ